MTYDSLESNGHNHLMDNILSSLLWQLLDNSWNGFPNTYDYSHLAANHMTIYELHDPHHYLC
ncbi:hypothetical protein [Fodinibius halophilus]|uniref:hypothetical protein n=1 Tax=Fodinibius halophilus TaxID=1736908 RepID=UPI00197ACC1B|nr:hypothetical protein [Fodinibius halophilus]